MPDRERWVTSTAQLTLEREHEKSRGPWGCLVPIMVFVVALGLVMTVSAGSSVLDGDLTSTSGHGRARWVTPPVALLIGVGLLLSPIGIVWQERRGSHEPEGWRPALSLTPGQVIIWHGPSTGVRAWNEVTDEMLAQMPSTERSVTEHYLAHPADRSELGSRAAQRRAESLAMPE